VHPPEARAQTIDDLGIVAELEAFGLRVEYDIPAPVSTGTVPQVTASARRSAGSEAASGLAAAPTRFDAVVGGIVTNLDGEPGSGDELALPQAECAYPGDQVDVGFQFPTDLRPDTAAVPPLGWSRAVCGAGPTVELHATTASADELVPLGPLVKAGAVVAEAQAGPSRGVLSATASARASDISILDGLIEIESVVAHGASRTNGEPGGASTEASVDLVGVSVAGVRFDIRGGDIVVAGTKVPLAGSAVRSLLSTVSGLLAPTGCAIAILDSPAKYPQGFLFGRPEPELGVAEDGTSAGSMTGGLLVQCEIPEAIGDLIGFNPQRLQVAVGFAFTSVTARADIGGFGPAEPATGTPEGGDGGGLAPPPFEVPTFDASGLPTPVVPVVADGGAAPTRPQPAGAPAESVTERIRLVAANFTADRPWLWGAALVLWVLLTHRGVDRVRRVVREAVG